MATTKLGVVPVSVALLLAVVAVAAAPAPAPAPSPVLMLERTVPLRGTSLLESKEQDKARLSKKRQGAVKFAVGGVPGLYYTRVKLGSPLKEYSLQFDTGSNIMWISCKPCTGCPTSSYLDITLEYYSPNSSSTSSRISCSDDMCKNALEDGYAICGTSDSLSNQCGYTVRYGDGSDTSGYFVSDTMYFDNVLGNKSTTSSSASIFFGCSNSRSGNLPTDGIIGFGEDPVSIISQLNSQGVSPKAFSHCLKGSADGGGVLVLGEVVEPGFVYTPLVPSQPHYSVNVKSIAVNGKKVPINPSLFTTSDEQATFVDTGTTLTYFPDGIYEPVVKAIDDAVPYSVRYTMSDGERYYIVSNRSLFPTVTLYFEDDAALTVMPKDYLWHRGSYGEDDVVLIGFQRSQDIKSYQRATILGDLVLHDKIFVYNLKNKRIGWVDYNCSLLNTTTSLVVSGSPGRHTPSYHRGLVAIGLLAVINSIAPRWP